MLSPKAKKINSILFSTLDIHKMRVYTDSMKQKILTVLFSLLILFSLWGKGPTREMPYYNYGSSERTYRDYGLSSEYKVKNIRHDETWDVTLYRKRNTDYIVFKYYEKAPSESQIDKMLEKNQSIWREYDKKNGSIGLCHIFIDSRENLIKSASYSEDY